MLKDILLFSVKLLLLSLVLFGVYKGYRYMQLKEIASTVAVVVDKGCTLSYALDNEIISYIGINEHMSPPHRILLVCPNGNAVYIR